MTGPAKIPHFFPECAGFLLCAGFAVSPALVIFMVEEKRILSVIPYEIVRLACFYIFLGLLFVGV